MKNTIWILLFLSLTLQAQFQINGVVKDVQNNKSVAFASIKTENGVSVISDGTGKFKFNCNEKTKSFQVTFAGFETKTISISNRKSFYQVFLTSNNTNLGKNLIASDDRANELIKKVISFKNENNPLKKLSTFQFKRYSKLIVTASRDSILGKIDTIFTLKKGIKTLKKIDSADFKFKKIITQHHLFESEKISQFQFNKSLKETVLGIKFAGLKEPIYELMGFNLQSFSIYDNNYELFTTKFNSPINDAPFIEYKFQVLDSTEIQNRKVILIYFKRNSKRTDGLEGVLYIDIKNFAIAKAVMRTRNALEIEGIHEYIYFENENIWFPSIKKFRISKGTSKEAIKILGSTIEFYDDNKDKNDEKFKRASDFTYLETQSTNSDIEFNKPIEIKRKFIAIEIEPDANKKPESFWNKCRADSLTPRDKKTYVALDSISVLNKVEKRLFFGRKIIKGFVPYNYFDIDLRTLLSFNNLEGFRIGLGGTSNEKFSKIFKIDSHLAYGLKDEAYKYHIGMATRVGNFSNTWLGVSYTDDLNEIASSTFLTDPKIFKIYTSQPVSTNTFYNYKSFAAYMETRIIPKTYSVWQISKSRIEPKFEYNYLYNNYLTKTFDITSASFSLQWNPYSNFMQTPRGKIEIEKKYPIFTIQFTQTIPKFLSNDFVFTKFDFKSEWAQKHLNGQKTSLLFRSGFAVGDIPITHLYSTSPNCLLNESVLRRFFSIIDGNTFETMYFNEFFSDKYVYFQIKHEFKRFKISKNFGTSIAFVNRAGWGNLDKRERHIGIEFKTLEQGYFETGVEFNRILKGLGIGSFYRYGPNQLPGFYDNFAIKASFVLDLGF